MLFGKGQSCERLDGLGFSNDQFSHPRFAFTTGSIHFTNLGEIAFSCRVPEGRKGLTPHVSSPGGESEDQFALAVKIDGGKEGVRCESLSPILAAEGDTG